MGYLNTKDVYDLFENGVAHLHVTDIDALPRVNVKEIPETGKVAKSITSQNILASGMSDDLKLFEIFKLYSEDLQKEYGQLYYALLGWKDAHLKELLKEKNLWK